MCFFWGGRVPRSAYLGRGEGISSEAATVARLRSELGRWWEGRGVSVAGWGELEAGGGDPQTGTDRFRRYQTSQRRFGRNPFASCEELISGAPPGLFLFLFRMIGDTQVECRYSDQVQRTPQRSGV